MTQVTRVNRQDVEDETELKESTVGWIAILSYVALCVLLYVST